MALVPVIGLEIHVQLKTKSKMFCRCDNSGENKPVNSCMCEICMGHPGTLPVPNKTAIEWALKASMALNCTINKESKFDRKHYFYPDLPKGYQISQYDHPFGKNGFLEINNKKIRINRLHLEEDAAKLLHPEGKNFSIVDYNRAGTPLIEIVTEPDIDVPKTAGEFLRELRSIMRVLGISDADMEKGHLRCDANISLRKREDKQLKPKTEIKNLNSFKAVEHALSYEIKRQTLLWEQNQIPRVQSTRRWDDTLGKTVEQRQKEEAHDYRYFPEPDIPPFQLNNEKRSGQNKNAINLSKIKKQLPELPQQKRTRFVNQYGLSLADAHILIRDYNMANYVEEVMSELMAWAQSVEDEKIPQSRLPKLAANWLINNVMPLIQNNWRELRITAENFAEFIILIAEAKLSSRAGQEVLKIMYETGKDPSDIMREEKLEQIEDESDELTSTIIAVLENNPSVVSDYKGGKKNALKFLLGQIMRETKGRANPRIVELKLKELI